MDRSSPIQHSAVHRQIRKPSKGDSDSKEKTLEEEMLKSPESGAVPRRKESDRNRRPLSAIDRRRPSADKRLDTPSIPPTRSAVGVVARQEGSPSQSISNLVSNIQRCSTKRMGLDEERDKRRDKRRDHKNKKHVNECGDNKTASYEIEEEVESQERKVKQLMLYQRALNEQIVQSDRLIKAVYRFADCIDLTEKAMKNLHDVMGDYWEDEWPNAERYFVSLQDQEELWDRYEKSMRSLLVPIKEYESQFESAEDKIDEYHNARNAYKEACASLDTLLQQRASGHDITFAESDKVRLGDQYREFLNFLNIDLPKVIASRVPFMENLFFRLSNNLLQFCLETCKVQSKSCQILSKLKNYDLPITLGEGNQQTTIRASPHSGAAAASAAAAGNHISNALQLKSDSSKKAIDGK